MHDCNLEWSGSVNPQGADLDPRPKLYLSSPEALGELPELSFGHVLACRAVLCQSHGQEGMGRMGIQCLAGSWSLGGSRSQALQKQGTLLCIRALSSALRLPSQGHECNLDHTDVDSGTFQPLCSHPHCRIHLAPEITAEISSCPLLLPSSGTEG